MIDPTQLATYVVRPVLKQLDLYSEDAEKLVLGTACVESDCGRWIRQLEDGPALGIFQMEPTNCQDIWDNFLIYRPELLNCVNRWMILPHDVDGQELIGNLFYATAMCRVHYARMKDPIPDTLPGQAAYWKCWYNSYLGRGTVEDYIEAWRRFVPISLYMEPKITREV